MQYEVDSPEEYVAALEDDWRKEKLLKLRSIIKTKAPQLEEGIEYKMLRYSDGQGTIFHLNAQKNYVSLYVGNAEKIDPDGRLLEGIDVGKGCIRFKKPVNISDTLIEEFISRTIDLREQGKDIDC